MAERLHIIEPTLTGEAGHCFSFISSLINAAGDEPLTVWCGRSAQVAFPETVRVNRFFMRKIRRLQALWLYRKLLKGRERIFVTTAGRTDLMLLDLAATGQIAPGRVYVYIHWFRPSRDKRAQLEKLARRQPEIVVLAPTASVCEELRAVGFSHTRLAPYPITPCETGDRPGADQRFSHLLFAGAAREDKGFPAVVDLVEMLQARGADIPITLQTSAEHYDKYDDATRQAIGRLEGCAYPHVRRVAETLSQADYQRLFAGAICLQLYSQKDFRDRISGVTLDALTNGSPVITLADTWMARIVARYDAGLVIDAGTPEHVYRAVMQVLESYGRYRDNALKAGRELQMNNDAAHLLRELSA
ncbi:glycosyltransferase family 4 protein [Geobacter sp. FeAm09]|uniref:glycosyltransferase family 4 protein n=1 Tax=Geobacter sp. FeAm09 TaxID=2597769 RepID=UPI0011F0540D|nr:glycosyltransferase family 4 protein [Geobacter sp. FeAm09]QEM67230.1 glycosyltransferase family 4 protein [Geobacter sp. FeAm09]